jgi:hypothetical protein
MNPVPRKHNEETEKAIQEFLDKGGKIQQFEYGKKSESVDHAYSFYGKTKKKVDPE